MEHYILKFLSPKDMPHILGLYDNDNDNKNELEHYYRDHFAKDSKVIGLFLQEKTPLIALADIAFGIDNSSGSFIKIHNILIQPEGKNKDIIHSLYLQAERYACLRDAENCIVDIKNPSDTLKNYCTQTGFVKKDSYFMKPTRHHQF